LAIHTLLLPLKLSFQLLARLLIGLLILLVLSNLLSILYILDINPLSSE
jgi:hypothetical protein